MSTLSDPEIFRNILENLQTGVYVLDRDQNILFWNAGAERILGKLPKKIYVEGHTDSKAYSENSNYTNWELSVGCAYAARKIMQQHGLHADQVTQVRGYAD